MSEFDDFLNRDPLQDAEFLTGAGYSDDEETSGLGLGLVHKYAAQKEDELRLRMDTYLNMPFNEALKVIDELGFERVMTFEYIPLDKEQGSIMNYFWRDGILLAVESYAKADSESIVNSLDFYYNWDVTGGLAKDYFDCVASGRFDGKLYNEGRKVWLGHDDGREALKHKLAKLEAKGEILLEWVGIPSNLDLRNYAEKRAGSSRKDFNKAIVANFRKDIQTAITPA